MRYKKTEFNHVNFCDVKKAAMFGLDARIALAIFGALSVITGAALFSAIGNAKTVSVLTEMQELSKAYESFYLDTGQHLPMNGSSTRDFKTVDLIKKPSNVNGWKGPYVSYTKETDAYLFSTRSDVHAVIFLRMKEDWGSQPDFNSGTTLNCSAGDKDCMVWSVFSVPLGASGLELAKKLDTYVDTTEGSTVGKLRYVDTASWKYICLNTGINYPM